jgi:hypothetical protein
MSTISLVQVFLLWNENCNLFVLCITVVQSEIHTEENVILIKFKYFLNLHGENLSRSCQPFSACRTWSDAVLYRDFKSKVSSSPTHTLYFNPSDWFLIPVYAAYSPSAGAVARVQAHCVQRLKEIFAATFC